MKNPIENIPQEERPEKKKFIRELEALFTEAENILTVEGREKAKTYLEKIYDDLIILNKRNKEDWTDLWLWNSNGDLTEKEFDKLNLRRKLLSNAIGIMTASGVVRHDLNKI